MLTAFQGDKTDMRARVTVLLFIMAYWLGWHGPTVFWATIGMCVLTLSVIGATSVVQGLQPPAQNQK